jgi:hypothetical protein
MNNPAWFFVGLVSGGFIVLGVVDVWLYRRRAKGGQK